MRVTPRLQRGDALKLTRSKLRSDYGTNTVKICSVPPENVAR